MHAAGVVIGQEAIDEYVPLSRGSDDAITTQFTMTTIEELGLLKMDFLGLRTLTVIQDAVHLIEKDTGKVIEIEKINYNDKNVYDSLKNVNYASQYNYDDSKMIINIDIQTNDMTKTSNGDDLELKYEDYKAELTKNGFSCN